MSLQLQFYPCAGVIVFRENNKSLEVLLVRTVDGHLNSFQELDALPEGQGHYGFPKGKREKKESVFENAYRELNEETDLLPEDLDQLETNNDLIEISRKGNPCVYYYLAKLKAESFSKKVYCRDEDEGLDVGWHAIAGALDLLKNEKNRAGILEKAYSYLN